MKFIKSLVLFLLIGIEAVSYSQNIGINVNRNTFYQKKSKKNLLGNFGIGLSLVKKDIREKFINYEMSAGLEFNNLTFIDPVSAPPFLIDDRSIYTHSINNFSVPTTISIKKIIRKSKRFQPYLGIGLAPNILFLSYAKVFYNDSLILKGKGIRLSYGEWFKIYDLFYLGMGYKKVDFRIKAIGIISKKEGIRGYHYAKADANIYWAQYSLQLLINL